MGDVEQEIAEQMGDDGGVPDGIDPETGEVLDPDAEPDAAAQAEPTPRTQKEIEAVQRALEKQADRHTKRVREIMGDDFAMLVPSPVDWTPGFIFNVPGMLPDDEQVAAFDAILGRGAHADLREAEDAEGCDKCNALGEVLTGSRKPGQETKPCSACTGTGWKVKAAPLAPVAPMPTPQTYNPPQPTGTGHTFGADQWGRPVGHLHYGIPPAQVGL